MLGWLPEAPGSGEEAACWSSPWAELNERQRTAAQALGYETDSWNKNKWLLPRKVLWPDLSDSVRQHLQALGEREATWDKWSYGAATNTNTGYFASAAAVNELRRWAALSVEQQKAAITLGFTESIWNNEEIAHVDRVITELFGSGFEGLITQGCDEDSFEQTRNLALAHPLVYASFGCHPKAAWFYNAEFEAKMLACMEACREKVVAFGEFGLDYSHPHFGPDASNRRQQRHVFTLQLKLAVEKGLPMVIHSREAERDTLRIMRQWVPPNWKVHVHAYRGSVGLMHSLLAEFQQVYIGMPGVLTMDDEHAKELCRQCPVERMLLETDAPYLPVTGHWLSHPGLVQDITVKLAELKGMAVSAVAAILRKNANRVYGI